MATFGAQPRLPSFKLAAPNKTITLSEGAQKVLNYLKAHPKDPIPGARILAERCGLKATSIQYHIAHLRSHCRITTHWVEHPDGKEYQYVTKFG